MTKAFTVAPSGPLLCHLGSAEAQLDVGVREAVAVGVAVDVGDAVGV